MSRPSSFGAVSVMPSLAVDDVEKASAFYRRLGFEELWRYPESGETTHIGIGFGEVSLMLVLCHDPQIQRQNLYLILREVGPFHEFVAGVLPDVAPLEDADYGMRDFAITDPWGHLLTFGEAPADRGG